MPTWLCVHDAGGEILATRSHVSSSSQSALGQDRLPRPRNKNHFFVSFGLESSAPFYYQQMKGLVLLCYGTNWSWYLRYLIDLDKTEFGQTDIAYLGHVVGNSSFSPLEAKVQAIKNLPVPNSKRDIRRFLGWGSYHWKFCKDFAKVTESLTQLLKENKFNWDNSCQTAFEQLKLLLINLY